MIFSKELISKSAEATRLGINEQFTPGPSVEVAAKALYDNILSKIPFSFIINSWYRSPRLNKSIGGSPTSDHMAGRAADLDSTGDLLNSEIFDWILKNIPSFDQLIWEFGNDANPSWVHVSFRQSGNRKQVLRAYKENGKTIYRNFKR